MQTDEITEEQEAVELSDYEKERGKPMPNIVHGAVQMSLGIEFSKQAKDRFLIISELTLEISASSLTPDLAVVPKRPLNWGREPARCKDVPTSVVEIVSPSQGYQIINDKIDLYFAHGVQSVWEVNPGLKYIAVHRPAEKEVRVIQHGEVNDPASGLSVRLEDIFS